MKKIFTCLMAIVVVGLLGCSEGARQELEQDVQKTMTQDLVVQNEYVSPLPDDAPIVKVATTGTMPPFSFQDEYGNMIGIDIDAIRAIGEEVGFKVEFYQETWQNLFASVVDGHRDLAISGISYSPQRDATYGLSQSYFINPSAIMYTDGGIKSENGLVGLRGKRIATMTGSKQEEQMKQVGGYSELLSLPSTFLLYEALMQNKVDAILQDEPLLKYTALNHQGNHVYVVPYESPQDPLSQQVILLTKDNTKLLKLVNDGIEKIKSNGRMQAIESKWLNTHAME